MMSTRLGDTLGENIYRGMVSIDFVRPVRFKKFYLAQDFAYVVHGLVNAMILAVVMTLFYGRLEVNITLLSSLRFCISVALALILNYQLTWLLGLTGFWLQTAWHIRWITSALIKTFSGTVRQQLPTPGPPNFGSPAWDLSESHESSGGLWILQQFD